MFDVDFPLPSECLMVTLHKDLVHAGFCLLLVASCGNPEQPAPSVRAKRIPVNTRLLDQPLAIEEETTGSTRYEALLTEEEIWILREPIAAGRWKRDPEHQGIERAQLPLPTIGAPRVHPVAEQLERSLLRLLKRKKPLPESGEYVLDGEMILRRKGDGPTGPILLARPISSSSLTSYVRSIDREGRVVPSEVRLGVDCRRATVAPAPDELVYQVKLPEEARFDFAVAVRRWEMMPQEGGLWLRPTAKATPTFRVSLELEGGARENLWEQTVERSQREKYVEASLDLSAWSGQLVRLHLECSLPAEQVASDWSTFVAWAEPLIWSARTRPLPNIIVILLDTLRADRLGCYGWERARTPNLDGIAERGVRFADAMSASSWTLPAHASLFTSSYPSQHGLWKDQRLPDTLETVGEVLGGGGYRTAAFAERGFLKAEHGFARGFEQFNSTSRNCLKTFGLAGRWIEERESPFFIFIHTYQVHTPYNPPARFTEGIVREYHGELPAAVNVRDYDWGRNGPPPSDEDIRYVSDLYDAEVAEVDHALGILLDRLETAGILENTLILITSDHGEEFFDHGSVLHGMSLYQDQLHIPMILYWKGHFEGGLVADHPVHLVDLAPTLTAAAGMEPPPDWVGVPLEATPPLDDRPLYVPMLTLWSNPKRTGEKAIALREGSLKYVDYPKGLRRNDELSGPGLFDLAEDPFERENLLDPKSAREWAKKAEEMRQRYPKRGNARSVEVSSESRRELEHLGYVGGDEDEEE